MMILLNACALYFKCIYTLLLPKAFLQVSMLLHLASSKQSEALGRNWMDSLAGQHCYINHTIPLPLSVQGAGTTLFK